MNHELNLDMGLISTFAFFSEDEEDEMVVFRHHGNECGCELRIKKTHWKHLGMPYELQVLLFPLEPQEGPEVSGPWGMI